ncbi:hypothetical protein EDF51_108167 [Curtobacterium sp. PhB25]|uniref:hypothetical protein n=1 Tax=unclassified Curtobacterium TaxID=257496 RepID=UPI001048ADCF|nr:MULTISPECIES: hypothetical protein [unclassified Curtobacterium]TCU83210.1 hypothetical protein EDF48_109147 [Curtobacterium sp. PhB191]TDW67848.1 hypothetical protein EDF51_108167 [Curtobacterium sp. PhB25]
MALHWFPDNSLICNFAAVDELDLLRASLHGAGRVVEAVAFEIERSTAHVPNLARLDLHDWFGPAIEFRDVVDQLQIEAVRTGRFGGSDEKPLEHLGESQTLHLLRTRAEFAGSVWISEDGGSLRVAGRMGIVTRDTRAVLEELVAFGEVTAQRAYTIAVAIEQADRPILRMPTSSRDLS